MQKRFNKTFWFVNTRSHPVRDPTVKWGSHCPFISSVSSKAFAQKEPLLLEAAPQGHPTCLGPQSGLNHLTLFSRSAFNYIYILHCSISNLISPLF